MKMTDKERNKLSDFLIDNNFCWCAVQDHIKELDKIMCWMSCGRKQDLSKGDIDKIKDCINEDRKKLKKL